MKPFSALALSCAAFTLFACDAVDLAQSGFATATAGGDLNTGLDVRYTDEVANAEGDGYTIEIGAEQGLVTGGFRASVGILPTSSVTDLPTIGTATYFGTYDVGYMFDLESSFDGSVEGWRNVDGGSIGVIANFNAGTLTGRGNGLDVNGTFSSSELGGSVTYRDVDGTLEGLIGGDQVIGIFHGNDADEIYAGGFIADKLF